MVPLVPDNESGIVDYPARLKSDNLFISFGGGVGSFGTNFTVFHCLQTTIWIDVGAGFPNHHTPGLHKLLPNRQLFLAFKPSAIFLTHGHEDHIGALPHLYNVIPEKTPIYGSQFTLALLRHKIQDAGLKDDKFQFREIDYNCEITLPNFSVHTFFMPHSIPQVYSVGIKLHHKPFKAYFTSDFKIQGQEKRHKPADIRKFGPVQYLFADSTGAMSSGVTSDETDVIKNLEKEIRAWEGRIFITTFASHVQRIRALYEIAQKTGREIGFLGMSVKTQWKAGFESGEISVPVQKMGMPSPAGKRSLWVVAGCQCDFGSSFYRLTHNEMERFHLNEKDLIIYSASMIPGNEGMIYECLNLAAAKGVKIIGLNREVEKLHTSGHGKAGDIQKVVSWLKPEKVVPVHGDPLHFYSFRDLLQEFTTTKLEIAEESIIYELLPQGLRAVEKLERENCLVEYAEIHYEKELYQVRKGMARGGICNIIISIETRRILKVDYVGATSRAFLKKMQGKFESQIYNIYNGMAPKPGTGNFPLKKFKEKIYRMHQETLGKSPEINLIEM